MCLHKRKDLYEYVCLSVSIYLLGWVFSSPLALHISRPTPTGRPIYIFCHSRWCVGRLLLSGVWGPDAVQLVPWLGHLFFGCRFWIVWWCHLVARWGLDLAPKAAACSVGSLPGQFIVGLSGLGWVPGLSALRWVGSGPRSWMSHNFPQLNKNKSTYLWSQKKID